MKNEKFCFSKGTGLIALVGVLLVGFVLLTQMTNQSISTSTRAAGGCSYSYSGVKYSIADGQCLKEVITSWSTSFQCNKGVVSKQEICNPVAAATGCTYKYRGKTFAVPVDTCLTDAADVNGVASPKNTSWRCVSIGNMQKLSSCNPVAAATGCTYNYSGQTFSLALNVCLKSAPAVNGVNPPLNSNKCIPSTATSTTGYVAKHTDCAPTCDEIGNAGFKCGGTVAYLARNAANTGTCKCQDTAAKSVNPAIWGP